MARRRFFVDRIHDGRAELTGDQAHHLRRVLRVEAGRRYEISDTERVYLAEVSLSTDKRVVFDIVEELPAVEPPVSLDLYLALIKFDRLELAIEKATELGVRRIVPVIASRSEKGLERAAAKRAERWRRIAREAGQQARRLRPPEIGCAVRFRSALEAEAGKRFILDERAGAPPLLESLPGQAAGVAEIALLVGPEGGWTDGERREALAAGWAPVSLGSHVLRAETAAIAATAVLSAYWDAAGGGRRGAAQRPAS